MKITDDMARSLDLVDILRIMTEGKEMNYIELLSKAVHVDDHADIVNMAKLDQQVVSITGEIGLARLYNESYDKMKRHAVIRVASCLGVSLETIRGMMSANKPDERVGMEVMNRVHSNERGRDGSEYMEHLQHDKYKGFVGLLSDGVDELAILNSARALSRLIVADGRVLSVHSIEFREMEIGRHIKSGEYVRHFPSEPIHIRRLVDLTVTKVKPREWLRHCLRLLLASAGYDIKDRYHDVFDLLGPHMLPHEFLEVELIASQ